MKSIMARAMSLPIFTAELGLNRYLEEIRDFPVLQPEEEYGLAKQWSEHHDSDAVLILSEL